ncbi:MAG: hypothetical protein ABSB67_06950 [Bryobacteraceae bacterium]
MDFDVNVRERILKPVNEVFDAVVSAGVKAEAGRSRNWTTR